MSGSNDGSDRAFARRENVHSSSSQEVEQPHAIDPVDRISQHPEIDINYFRPVDVLPLLESASGAEGLERVRSELRGLPGFLRIQEAGLKKLARCFEAAVNVNALTGHGTHPVQRELFHHALQGVMQDHGWNPDNCVLIGGGTPVGKPNAAISYLSSELGFASVAIIPLVGMRYSLSQFCTCVCMDDRWKTWGSEFEAMLSVCSATLFAGAGVQVVRDALFALREKRTGAVIANSYNQLTRIEYEIHGVPGVLLLADSGMEGSDSDTVNLEEVREHMKAAFRSKGVLEHDIDQARITGVPVNGLVSEIRNGKRNPCMQDLIYFAMVGSEGLLPEEFRSSPDLSSDEFRRDLLTNLPLYYLLDDPGQGLSGSAVIRLNEAITLGLTGVLEKVIDHAVEHDLPSPATGHFGPSALNARSKEELADILKEALLETVETAPLQA